MSTGHDHGTSEIRYEKPLWWALGLTSTFLIAEIIGGLVTNSLALLSDAAHMMTDVIALGVSLFAVRMARRPADAKRTYGYARMEALGALVLLLLIVWWTMFSGRKKGELPGQHDTPPRDDERAARKDAAGD